MHSYLQMGVFLQEPHFQKCFHVFVGWNQLTGCWAGWWQCWCFLFSSYHHWTHHFSGCQDSVTQPSYQQSSVSPSQHWTVLRAVSSWPVSSSSSSSSWPGRRGGAAPGQSSQWTRSPWWWGCVSETQSEERMPRSWWSPGTGNTERCSQWERMGDHRAGDRVCTDSPRCRSSSGHHRSCCRRMVLGFQWSHLKTFSSQIDHSNNINFVEWITFAYNEEQCYVFHPCKGMI